MTFIPFLSAWNYFISFFLNNPEQNFFYYYLGRLKEDEGLVKRKKHAPSPDKVNFDRAGLLAKVRSMKPGDHVIAFHLIFYHCF